MVRTQEYEGDFNARKKARIYLNETDLRVNSQSDEKKVLDWIKPTNAQRCRSETENFILYLFSSVLLNLKKKITLWKPKT